MKTLISLPFCDFLVTVLVIFKDWCIIVRYLQNEITNKTCFENHWRKEQDPEPASVYKSDILVQCGPGSGVLMNKNEKFTTEKKVIHFYISKITIHGLHKGRWSYRRSLQPSKNIQLFKKLKISSLFLFLMVTFALLDPDPADQNLCVPALLKTGPLTVTYWRVQTLSRFKVRTKSRVIDRTQIPNIGFRINGC